MLDMTGVGSQLRTWRERRRLSQLDLALEVGVSTKHLSFLETGRSRPSREMVLRLADRLEVPLRERNAMLMQAGFAPVFTDRPLDAPEMAAVRHALDLVLRAHEPWPALAVDRLWTLQAANRAVAPLLSGADPSLLAPPLNILRLSLHPRGLASRIRNLGEWKDHVLARLRRQLHAVPDPALAALIQELSAYPAPHAARQDYAPAMRVEFDTGQDVLTFITTVTVFGSPHDVTVEELAIETLLPADAATAAALRALTPTDAPPAAPAAPPPPPAPRPVRS
jgi:transcriptional regulator with XRE-family HTH domain